MSSFLFGVPESLRVAYELGEVQRYGALLKDAGTGRIVAHLQETSLGQSLVARAINATGAGITSPIGPLGFATSAFQVFQNEQIKQAIAVLQQFQIFNLFLSGVGIGVSAAGFAIMNRKIGLLRSGLDRVGSAVERLAAELDRGREDLLDRDLARLDAACRQVEEGWLLRNAERQWQDAAVTLAERQADFFAMAMRARQRQGPGHELFALLVEAWLLAGAARMTARLAANEMQAALAAAREATRAARELTGGLDAVDLASDEVARMPEAAYRKQMVFARLRLDAFREREDVLESKVLLIRHLVENEISGRAYLEVARDETAEALLLLRTDRQA